MRWAERDGSEMKRSMDSGKVMSRIGEVNLEKVESEKKTRRTLANSKKPLKPKESTWVMQPMKASRKGAPEG